jgi:hypothetical protein
LDRFAESIFLGEIRDQCELALFSFSELKRVLAEDEELLTTLLNMPMPNSTEEMKQQRKKEAPMKMELKKYKLRIWIFLESFLTFSANVSKFFWPAYYEDKHELSKEYSERGKHLRSLLGISNKSPLNNRELRNHFEHYDERLHEWAKKIKRVILSHNIGRIGYDPNADPHGPEDMLNFDDQNFLVSLWGKRHAILPLVEEITKLFEVLNKKLD